MNKLSKYFKNIYLFESKLFKNFTIRARILTLFLAIIAVSILIVAISSYQIGSSSMEGAIKTQLNNSARYVVDQVRLLSGAYSSREFSDKLNYILTEELAGLSQSGLNAQIYLIDSSGYEIDRSNIRLKIGRKTDLPDAVINEALKMKNQNMDVDINGDLKSVSFSYIVEKDWIYAVAVSKSSYLKPVYKLQIFTIISGIVALILALFFSYLGTRGIINTIRDFNKTVSIADSGDLRVRAKSKYGGPEMREFAGNFNAMLSSFENMVKEIGASIEELTVSSESLTSISKESEGSSSHIHKLTVDMANGSEKQKLSIINIKESKDRIMDIINSIINQINNTSAASSIMMDAVYEGLNAVNGLREKISNIEEVSDSSVSHMKILESHSNKISNIANTIKGISNQTKLLSFNASIEAARAGEYGAGFSVVAQEIQKLAQSSAQSAHEVGEIIKEIQKSIGIVTETGNRGRNISHDGSLIASKASDTFNAILDKVTETHGHITSISGNAQSMSENISIFSDNIEAIANIIIETAENSEEVAVTVEGHKNLSGSILSSANNLLDMAQKLNKSKDKYITG